MTFNAFYLPRDTSIKEINSIAERIGATLRYHAEDERLLICFESGDIFEIRFLADIIVTH